jgi:hypothetical protein
MKFVNVMVFNEELRFPYVYLVKSSAIAVGAPNVLRIASQVPKLQEIPNGRLSSRASSFSPSARIFMIVIAKILP